MTSTPEPNSTPADVVGLPFMPPARVSTAATRARSAVAGLTIRMAPPPVAVLEALFGVLDHRVLVALCDAEIPDLLVAPTRPSELAHRAAVDPERLERLLRRAAVNRWVRFDRRGRVRPTRFTRFLRRGHPGGWRAWVDFLGGAEISAALASLSASRTPVDPFHEANGAPFFEWMSRNDDRWDAFDQAMAAGARMHGLALRSALDWPAASKVCDIGGGTGHLLLTLLQDLPASTGTVLDLPDVITRAVHHERVSTVAGDMFDTIPTGFDTYLLVNVLHDWGDYDVTSILTNVAASVGAARVLVIDADRPKIPRDRMSTAADVLMGALTGGGRERDCAMLAALAASAGLQLVQTTRLASGDLAHELRRAPSAP